ncbi:DUF4352 domain-containing protein [Halobellus sp. GM3]|uniref:DUF4352 domain-containing protein n=1 Tax=Halobellus sp. GM3 TaxID=3458410 RepID=UPI00403DF6AE
MDRRHYLVLAGGALSTLAGCTSSEEPQEVTGGSDSGNSGSTDALTTGTSDETEPDSSTPQGPTTKEVSLGQVVKDDSMAMVVREISTTEKLGEFQEADSGNEFKLVRLAIKNDTKDTFINFSGLLQTRLKDGDGYTYQQTLALTGQSFDGGQLAPGEVSRGDIVYEVPKDASGLIMQFDFQSVSFFQFDRVEIDLSSSANSIQNLSQSLQIKTYQNGDTVEYGGTEVTINSVEFTDSVGQFTQAEEGEEYAIVDITTTNNTGEEQSISTALQMLVKDGKGFSYGLDLMATSQLDRNYEQGSALADGETRRGKVAYAVPKDASPLYWIFEFTLWTSGNKTFWKLR